MSKKDAKAGGNGRERKAAKKALGKSATPEASAPAPDPKPAAVATVAKPGALPPLPKLPKSGNGSRERKPKPVQDCTCGCGGKTTGAWVPGHDARARGWAIRIERGLIKMKDVPENEQAGAKFMLKDRAAKGLTGKGITLAKGNSKVEVEEVEEEKSEAEKAIDEQVATAIADGMAPEAAEGLRESLLAGLSEASGQ